MFERYTEKARRTVFYARFEASRHGATLIEPEHLLLGLARENLDLLNRFLTTQASDESLRDEIVAVRPMRPSTPTSADLPLSEESKRMLAQAVEEAERLNRKEIGCEHLLLGLLREEKCFAAQMLRKRGADVESIRKKLASEHTDSSMDSERPNPPKAGFEDYT